ncbi:MAG: 8-oxo-dGTP diphosphatase [Anaerolineae bacterium]|nr:8-oxo-dGTP diphosphatase [Anaerolineae bacterium]
MTWQLNSAKPIERVIPGSLCYLVHDQKVLLIQRRNPPHVGLWSPPGGKLNPGESPTRCVLREFYEETGLMLQKPRLRVVTTVLHAGMGMQFMLFVYSAKSYSGKLAVSDEGDIQWVGLDELDRYPRPPADVRVFQHVLRKAPVCEMEFRYDTSDILIEQTASAAR